MAMSPDEFIKKIKADAIDFANNVGKEYNQIVTKELTDKAKFQMNRFYKDYSPKVYTRTGNLMNRSYYPISKNEMHVGDTYYGGIRINSDNMYEYYTNCHDENGFLVYRKPTKKSGIPIKDLVVYNSQKLGVHGSKDVHVTTTTPLDVLNKIKDRIAADALKQAMEKARHQQYRLKYSFS